MRISICVPAVVAVLVNNPLPAIGQTAVARECRITSTVVATRSSVLVRCDQTQPSMPTVAELWLIDKVLPNDDADPRTVARKVDDLAMRRTASPRWLRFELPAGSSLLPGKEYYIHVPASVPLAAAPEKTWPSFWHLFSTESVAVIVDSPASFDAGSVLVLENPVALKRPLGAVELKVLKDGRDQTIPAAFEIPMPEPSSNPADPSRVGQAWIRVGPGHRLPAGEVRVSVAGLIDIFDQEVSTDPGERTSIGPRMLSGDPEDESGTYLKFAHSVSAGKKGNGTVDANAKIELPYRLRGWRTIPFATVDVGIGESDSDNTMTAGVSFMRTRGIMRLSVAPAFETDRDFTKRNGIVGLQLQPFWSRCETIACENRRRLNDERTRRPKSRMDEIVPANFGHDIAFTLGVEMGRSFDTRERIFEREVAGEKIEETVTAPVQNILRLTSTLGLLFEAQRLSIRTTVMPRLLLAGEHVLEEQPDKTIGVRVFDGWQVHSEVGVAFALTDRTSLDITYKAGRQPPTYARVNTVQTGISIKF